MDPISQFIELDASGMASLFLVGLVGGMVSGFIGSGGAFVFTPAMMSMGVPGIVAVASNMCDKFPTALVGAYKRARFGQVDVKLGLIMGASAEVGVLVGVQLQENIKAAFGDAGSNLYVSVAFVGALSIAGTYVLWDAWKIFRSGNMHAVEKTSRLALWVRTIRIPHTMVYLPSIKAEVSFLITIPLGFATGMLAAAIAVGGFIGVPSMIYVLGVPSLMSSATELVIAFVMGLGGTLQFALAGFVDIRLAMIILAGSLFGIQIGAIGTTYVPPFTIKILMGVIMITVMVSRVFVIPVYLSDLGAGITLGPTTAWLLKGVSFWIMVAALVFGAVFILAALARGMAEAKREALQAPGVGR
jgi:uncharacterized membrane protein YfcA